MPYGSILADTLQSSVTGTPPVIRDGNGTETGQLCRAWVNFNGTTSPGTIRAAFNVSSVTKNGTADYTVNLTTAMPDVNYAALVYFSNDNTTAGFGYTGQGSIRTTGSYRFTTLFDGSGVAIDRAIVNVAVFR